MPSFFIFLMISSTFWPCSSFHFALPVAALMKKLGSTVLAIEWYISVGKVSLPPAPMVKQVLPIAVTFLQVSTHDA